MKYELKNGESFVDFKTAHYYSTQAASLAEKYGAASPGYDSLCKKYTGNNARLLDIGCGTGRDIAEFRKAGFTVIGAEVSEEMIAQASVKYPEISKNLFQTGLPELTGITGTFDVILCSGVIQHIQTQFLYESFRTVTSLLEDKGIFILSFPLEYPDIDKNSMRDKDGRLFIIRPEEKYRFLIERQGFIQLERIIQEDSLSRQGIKWAIHIYRKVKEDSISPISIIDSVLREDSKNTTYKFALLRALSDIASYSYNAAEWYHDGNVGIGIDLITAKWIDYFWPIVSSPVKILQGSNKIDIAFRNKLATLADAFGGNSGQPNFQSAVSSDKLSAEQIRIKKDAVQSIRTAIINGPVKYCGNIKTGEIFSYKNKKLIIPADIWKEFVLMGQWIEDSIILRWADFTAGIAANKNAGIKTSSMLDLLLYPIEIKRDTKIAGNILKLTTHPLECVWSGQTLGKYDIDHALPFSVWRNNDLWNLFPAEPKVNNNKRDKFPSLKMLSKSKKRIFDYWDIYYETQPNIFISQAAQFCGELLTGLDNYSRDLLFSAFSETVDYAALQRGAERWEI